MNNDKLNRAVAEKIFGWQWDGDVWIAPNGISLDYSDIPDYCGDANLTMQVVEEMRKNLCFQVDTVGFAPNIWRCMIGWSDDPVSEMAEAETFGRAVCLAALKARGESIEGL